MELRVRPKGKHDEDVQYLPENFKKNKLLHRLFPKIYFIGQENCVFNYTNFALWIIEGILEAVLITLFCIYIFSQPSLDSTGINPDLWLTGLTM